MTGNFLELARKRRTIYVLGKDIPVPENELIGTVIEAVKQAPSAFNSQSSRLLILLGEQHARLWELTREQLRKIVPAESFSGTSDKIDGFAATAGSILFSRISMLSSHNRSSLRPMRTISRYGLSTAQVLHSMLSGWRWLKKELVPTCSIIIL